jgi:hypothetical protein
VTFGVARECRFGGSAAERTVPLLDLHREIIEAAQRSRAPCMRSGRDATPTAIGSPPRCSVGRVRPRNLVIGGAAVLAGEGIDRMHATSRVRHARCRPMTARRGTSTTLDRRAATRQVDRDASGERDHTAVVSRVVARGASGRVIEVAEHSPAGLHAPVDALIAAPGGHGVIHYWHLLQ